MSEVADQADLQRLLISEPESRSGSIDWERLDTHGFDVIRLFGEPTVGLIQAVLDHGGVPKEQPFFASPAHTWDSSAAAIHSQLQSVCRMRMDEVLSGYRQFMIAVTSKSALTGRRIKYHQDWTYTDERIHMPIFMWVPLVDCVSESGALRVVPGSHRWSSGIRPSRRFEVTDPHPDGYEPMSIGPIMPKGDAIVFYPSLLHGSWSNRTPNYRPAITIASAPDNAQLVHYHLFDCGLVKGYEVGESFFTTNHYGQPPTGCAEYEVWTDIVAFEELDPATRTIDYPRTE